MPAFKKIQRAKPRKKQVAGTVVRDPLPGEWVCAKCGSPGGTPDNVYTSLDDRYRVGSCPAACRGTVSLILGSAFDRDVWEVRAKAFAEQNLYDKLLRGAPMTDEEKEAAIAVRDRRMRQVLAFGDEK